MMCMRDLGASEPTGEVVRLLPVRVLVLSPDDCFRSASCALLGRRGCAAFAAAGLAEAIALCAGERIDVLLVERTSDRRRFEELLVAILTADARVRPDEPRQRWAPVGVVAVVDDALRQDGGRSGREYEELAKWSPFEELFASVVRTDGRRRIARADRSSRWSPARQERSGESG